MSHTYLKLRSDGNYDHIEVSDDGVETVFDTVLASNKDMPFGPPDDEQAEVMNRSLRENFLKETDWWASSDLTMTQAQRTYRQALRDITDHANWPHLLDADWPTKP